jgi:hypothetical protein
MPKHSYTQVESPGDFEGAMEIWCCNSCGAHGPSKEEIKHFQSCQSGESEKWEEFYSRQDDEQDLEEEITLQDAPHSSSILEDALKWWDEEASCQTTGEYGEYNVFDETPGWVLRARVALKQRQNS